MSSKDFYRAFEDKHRGSRELITERISVYLPLLLLLKQQYEQSLAIDIGCGRGEWLELLTNHNIKAKGVDLDQGMLQACKILNLDATYADGIEYLKKQDNESCIAISAFHVVEHISFEELQTLVKESLRVLKPAGILILETPNPENIKVATENFYLDPTHIKPIPSALLSFLPEFHGYKRTKVLRLQESKELQSEANISLFQVFEGVSPDYAIIAQKDASFEILEKFDEIFNKDFGLSLHSLTSKFENRLVALEQKATQAQEKATQAEEKATQAQSHYHALLNSRSWKITKPLREFNKFLKWFKTGVKSWITFSPQSRPRRVLLKTFNFLKTYIASRPKLKYITIKILHKFPKLRNKLLQIQNPQKPAIHISELSARANEIYHNLKNLQKNNKDS